MRLRKLSSTGLALFISLASLLCINPQVAFATSFTCLWVGGGGDSNFSTAANWGGCNSTSPQPGDALVFGFVGTSDKNPTNDTAGGTLYASITFDDSGFVLSGNSMGVTGSISDGSGGTNVIQAPISADSTASVDGSGSSLTISDLTIGCTSTVGLSGLEIQSLKGCGSLSVANIGSGVTVDSAGNNNINTMNINADTTANGTFGAIQINVATGATFTAGSSSTVAGDITVNDGGTFVLDGAASGKITVDSGGTVKGTGAGGSPLIISQGGTLAPGHSPGCYTATTISLSGSYQAEIAGATTACTDYDQLIVTNTVNITNGTLDVQLTNGFTPTVGQTFKIIDNQGISPILGTFNGLAEGATVSTGGYDFKLSYVGGNGNDVTLTALGPTPPAATPAAAAPAAPDTGLAAAVSHPAATLVATTIAALMIAIIAKRLRPVKS